MSQSLHEQNVSTMSEAIDDDYVFTLSNEDSKYAEEYLNETEGKRNASLIELRQWLKEAQPNLHARTEAKYLLPFLRGCKFDMIKTKKKITNFYRMRRDEPQWFTNRDPTLELLQDLVKLGVFVPLKQSSDNKLVVIIRTAAHNPKVHSIHDVFKVGKMILDIAAYENERCIIYGVTAIFDMSGIALGHATQLTPGVIGKAINAWQNYHCRPKQMEFINAPSFINVMLNIFKSFMSQKMKERVRVHYDGIGTLHTIVDKSILPPEYGGEGESVESLCHFWSQKLIASKDWFAEDEKYRAE